MHELMSLPVCLCQGIFMAIFSTTVSLNLQLLIFCFKVPSLIGEMLTPSCHPSRDGELKPKRESENAPSLPMRSLGKPVMTSNSVNAMPWFMDTMLPTTAISDSAGGPNEIGESLSLPRASAWFHIPLQ